MEWHLEKKKTPKTFRQVPATAVVPALVDVEADNFRRPFFTQKSRYLLFFFNHFKSATTRKLLIAPNQLVRQGLCLSLLFCRNYCDQFRNDPIGCFPIDIINSRDDGIDIGKEFDIFTYLLQIMSFVF